MVKQVIENVKDDGKEFEMLLNEIPHATSSHNLVHDHHDHVMKQGNYGFGNGVMNFCYDEENLNQMNFSRSSSTVTTGSGFSIQSDHGSSSSLFSDNGSPTTPSFMEDLKSTISSGTGTGTGTSYGCSPNNNTFWLDCKIPDFKDNTESKRFVDLCGNFSKMHIGGSNGNQHKENPSNVNDFTFLNPINVDNYNNHDKYVDVDGYKRGILDSDYVGFQSPMLRSPINHHGAERNSALSRAHKVANSFGSAGPVPGLRVRDIVYSQLNGFGGSMDSPYHRRETMNDYYCRGSLTPDIVTPSLRRNSAVNDTSLYALDFLHEVSMSRLPFNSLHDGNSRTSPRAVPPSNARIPQGHIDMDSITSEGSFILQGEGLNCVGARGSERSRFQNAAREFGFAKHPHRSELDIQQQVVGAFENPRRYGTGSPFTLQPKYNSLLEARGCIYLMAKDQNGGRFLQKMFDEGRIEDIQMIFNEIIGHVVELMMSPFGNYLIQKLLDVCSEEQRMQIILMVIQEPRQLVRISLNTHGTRVVQKLIETLKTRQQVSLVISALEPGFLILIKDNNGNHVVQHCLECLRNEDNKFIFVAAARHCVDIATHQHGCCVLPKCIRYSSGEHRQRLVAEISANALLLAQDKYGNYVVQYVLDFRIPSAAATLTLQFEGNYVHMSMQKFSSRVVEKCLVVFNDENRAKIIHELLSDPHFDLLLQDPHANYVIQKALRHSEGHVYNLLVEKIESYKAICRNSPYSKKIFSQKLLKK